MPGSAALHLHKLQDICFSSFKRRRHISNINNRRSGSTTWMSYEHCTHLPPYRSSSYLPAEKWTFEICGKCEWLEVVFFKGERFFFVSFSSRLMWHDFNVCLMDGRFLIAINFPVACEAVTAIRHFKGFALLKKIPASTFMLFLWKEPERARRRCGREVKKPEKSQTWLSLE